MHLHALSILLFIPIILHSSAEHVASYSETKVLTFIRSLENSQLSAQCSASLKRIFPLLKSSQTLDDQRRFFHDSFASGDAKQFLSRDLDRWFYKSMECLKVSGQTPYSSSEYPLDFCFGMDTKQADQVYGICIPSPCEEDRQVILKQWQTSVLGRVDNSTFDYDGCTQSRYENQWYANPVPLINFIFDHLLTALICLATVYDIKRHGTPRSTLGHIFIAFSYTGNLKKLIQLPKDNQSTILCMFGIRFLCMIWTLVGHSFYLAQSFMSNVEEFRADLNNSFWNQSITNFTLGVDVFLTLSGTLISYSWFKRHLDKHQKAPGFTDFGYWLRFYRHRLIRLWPAYLYALVMLATRLPYTHWHQVFSPTDPSIECPKHWYKNVFMLNSVFGSMCMPWTWYISAEFIFYTLSPVFLIILNRNQFEGILLIVLTVLTSSFANTLTMYKSNFPPIPLSWGSSSNFNDNFLDYHFSLYIKPWNRVGPYLIGMLLGYHLARKFVYSDLKEKKSTSFVVIGWLCALFAMFWALFGAYPAIQGWDWPVYHLFYGSTHRTVFSLGIAWLVYACHTGIAKPLNAFLGSRVFLPLSNLSYSVYLIHMTAIAFTYLIVPFPFTYTGKLPLFAHCVVQLFISYVLGGRIAFAVELPFIAIERVLLGQKKKSELKPVTEKADEKTKLNSG